MAQMDLFIKDVMNSTLPALNEKFTNDLEKASPLFEFFEKNRKIKAGGTYLEEPILVHPNRNVGHVTGYQSFPTTNNSVFEKPKFFDRLIHGAILICFDEKRQNKGAKKLFDLAEGKAIATQESILALTSYDMWGFSSVDENGVQMYEGISALISDHPETGIVGGYDRATNAWWRNKAYDLSAPGAYVPESFRDALEDLYLDITNSLKMKGDADKVIGIFMSRDHYKMYLKMLWEKVIIGDPTPKKVGDSAFNTLSYDGIPVYQSDEVPEGHTYFVNGKNIYPFVDPDADFTHFDPVRIPNQLVWSTSVVRAQGLGANRARTSGVIFSKALSPAKRAFDRIKKFTDDDFSGIARTENNLPDKSDAEISRAKKEQKNG